MKTRLFIAILILLATSISAQIKVDLKSKIKRETNDRANQHTDNAIDEGFDGFEDGVKSIFKGGKDKDKDKSEGGQEAKSPEKPGKEADYGSFSNLFPPDGATDVPLDVEFSWQVDGSSIEQYGHEFYLSTSNVELGANMVGGPKAMKFKYDKLQPQTKYYWKVVAAGDKGYIPGPDISFTTAAAEAKMDVQWSKYDFVPGDEVIFSDGPDMLEENGEFPSRWDLVSGQVEIASVNGENVIAFLSGTPYIVPYVKDAAGDYLPDIFTIEFDIYRPAGGNRFFVNLYDEKNQRAENNEGIDIGYNYISLGDISSEYPANLDRDKGRWIHISIAYTKGKLKMYMDDTRLINIPHYEANPTGFSIQCYFANSAENLTWYLKNVRIAKGGVKYYDRAMQDGKIICNGIRFDISKTTLRPESMGQINEIYRLMEKHPEIRFSVEGHTDSDGDENSNLKLSEGRAKAVMDKLIEMGISAERLTSKGFGESKPIAGNDTPEGKANNRRVEFVKM